MNVIVNPGSTGFGKAGPGITGLDISGPGITLAEFLAWEREQPERFEFDGRQPIPMTGGSVAHARMIRKLIEALARRLPSGFEWLPGELKVVSSTRVRYPDVLVINQEVAPNADDVPPVAVFEVLSPSTALTDLRVKPADYAGVETIQVYVILPQERDGSVLVLRRTTGWQAEAAAETLHLPEIGVTIPLSDLFG